jgi:hypothetical protein
MEDKIGSYIDLDAVKGETTEMLSEMNKLLKHFQKFDGLSISLSNVKGTRELKELSKQVADVTDKVVSTQKNLDRVMVEAQLAKQKYNKELKAEIELQNATTGSIDKARAAIKLYTAERNKLDLSTAEGTKRQKELNAELDKQNAFIKDSLDQQGKQKLNIGNYEGSAKIIVDALGTIEKKIETLKEKQAQLQNLSQSNPIGFKLGNNASELNQVNAQLGEATKQFTALSNVTNNPQFLNVASKFGDARTEIRGFTATLVELEQKGLGSTNFATELRQRLAELSDQVSDTKSEIKALSSDTRGFDLFAGSVSFAADAFQAAAGAAVLFGASEEDAAQATKTLVAIQTVSNGVKGIANELTTRGTAANKAFAFVQTQYAVATNSSTAATVRLGAAMKLIGIGLAIGAIALIVTKFQEWSAAARRTSLEQETLSEVTLKAADSYGQEKAKLDVLIGTIKTEGISRKAKFETLKQLQEAFPGYFDNIKTEADLNNNLAAAYANATNGILAKAKAQAASSLLAENFSKQLTLESELNDQIAKNTKTLQEQIAVDPKGAEGYVRLFKLGITNISADYDGKIKEVKTKNDLLVKTVIESNKEIDALGGKVNGNKTGSKTSTPKAEKEDDQAAKDLQARFDAYKIIQERELELIAQTRDDEAAAYADRLVAATQYAIKKQKLISDEAEFEKKTKKLSKPEQELVDTKAFVERQRISEESEKKIFGIQEKYRSKTVQLSALEIDKYSASYNRLKAALDDYAKKQAEVKEKEKELYDQRISRVKDFVNQVKEATFEIFAFGIENQQNEIEEEATLLEERKNKQILVASQTIQNAEEREKAIAEIEARSAAQKQALDKRNGDLEERKAKLGKVAALFNIGITAAQEIFKIKAAAAELLSNPFTAALAPMALAQIPIVLIGAALSAAMVAAKPIPKYWRGKDQNDNYEGPAIVGDGGKPELIVREDGSMEVTPAKDSLTYIGAKDKIYPDAHAVFKDGAIELNKTIHYSGYAKQDHNLNASKIVSGINKGINDLKRDVVHAVKNIPQPIIKTRDKLSEWVRGNDSIEKLNRY